MHEGSHGLGDKLVGRRCINYMGNEFFDVRRLENATYQLEALTRFFSMRVGMKAAAVLPGIGHDLAKKFDTRAKLFDADCSCSALGALVRVGPKNLCQLPRGIKPYILVRTDLMRWSLSVYSEYNVNSMPQFNNKPLPKTAFRIEKLSNIANYLIGKWRDKAEMFRRLVRCKFQPQLITFEAFEDSQDLPRGLVRQLLPCGEEDRRREYSTVRIVHSHRISEFVENSDEVIAHFAVTQYPSFADVFKHRANATAAEVVVG